MTTSASTDHAKAVCDEAIEWQIRLSTQQELDLIREMLQELPEITRHVFMLNRIEGLFHTEVAMRLGISVRSCGRHLAEALRHLLTHKRFDE